MEEGSWVPKMVVLNTLPVQWHVMLKYCHSLQTPVESWDLGAAPTTTSDRLVPSCVLQFLSSQHPFHCLGWILSPDGSRADTNYATGPRAVLGIKLGQ